MAGAGVYTYQLVRALAGLDTEHHFFVFGREGLFEGIAHPERFRVLRVEPPWRGARLAWEQSALPLLLRKLAIDVLHSPHHHTPVLSGRKGSTPRRVVTVHDVTFLILPERYPLGRRLFMEAVTRASAAVADAIITPSQAVRRDVVSRLGRAASDVVAIPEAAAPTYQPSSKLTIAEARSRYNLPDEYLISVGSLEPGKNRARLFRAVAALEREGIRCNVAVVGQPAWNYAPDHALLRQLGLEGRVQFLGYVPDQDMPALYSGATALAFPSLYEGFGLPVLEAMACGTPVLTSNVSATAEITGDAAVLVDPYDVTRIADGLRNLCTDDVLRADLRERGRERAAEFSWERTARETLLLYELVSDQ
jgi:glycosyltransferase involved in cell wall biosynthesis